MPYKRYGRRILTILLVGILFITNWGMNKRADDGAGSGHKELCERCCVCVF